MFDVIIVANGTSSRMGFDKLSFQMGDKLVLQKTVDCFDNINDIDKIIVVSDNFLIKKDKVLNVKGGSTRSASVKCGLEYATSDFVLIHDGARPFVSKDLIYKLMQATKKFHSAVPYLPVYDSLRIKKGDSIGECVDRENFVTVQTPQGFATNLIKKAYVIAEDNSYTDDSEVFSRFISPAHLVEGEQSNKKITTPENLIGTNSKIGCGFDVHRFARDRKLILGGIDVPYPLGMDAHSDGDVVIHALMDALLSAIGERDIGVLFPDNDDTYKDIDSSILLSKVKGILDKKNADIISISIIIMAQKPKLSNFIPLMKKRLADILDIDSRIITISATTTENLGITSENSGIASFAMISIN